MPAPNSFYRISPSGNPPLRIGLLLDSKNELPAFCVRIVEDIQASNFAQVKLLVLRKAPELPPAQSPGENSHRGRLQHVSDPKLRKRIVYDLYLRLDSRKRTADDPIVKTACADLLGGITTLEVEPIGKKFIHRFPDDALAAIRSHDLDVLIRFGFNILHGDILRAARYGVWSYHHGDNEFYRGGPPHLWELVEGSLLTGVILQVLSEELDDGLVLCKSQFATENTISVSRNRYGAYWGSTEMMIRKLNELHQFGWQSLLEKSIPAVPYRGKRKIYKNPTNADLLPWLAPALAKKAVSYPFRKPIVQHWKIGCRADAQPLYDLSAPEQLSDFQWLEAPHGHFWADPFGLEHEGQNWVFFEDYSYAEKRAAIMAAELSAPGLLSEPVPCLGHPSQHFSYPHVFVADSELFMIPESYDANSVDLYRCQSFPRHWVREATLLEGRFVDTTVWERDGYWWLLTTTSEPHPRAGSLLLFYSKSLTGPWLFHPDNPISTDIRRNRGAGRMIQAGDRLIRPSQCCAPTYGYSLAFNQVTELSPRKYAERRLATITPEHWKNFSGVHTYSRAGRMEWIDGCQTMPLRRVASPARP